MDVYEHNLAIANARKNNSKYKKGEAIVDDDGFTLVTRGGVYGQTVGGGVGVASKKFMDEVVAGKGEGEQETPALRRKKRKQKEKEGMYSHQLREKRIKGEHFARWPFTKAIAHSFLLQNKSH